VAEQFDPELAATWVADNLLGELNYRRCRLRTWRTASTSSNA